MFNFAGCKESKAVFKDIEKAWKEGKRFHIVYGIIGYGKSYMLVGMVLYMIKNEERVIYIPTVSGLLSRQYWYQALSLLKTVEESRPDRNNELLKTITDLIYAIPETNGTAFKKYTFKVIAALRSVVFVVDQWDAIDDFNFMRQIVDAIDGSIGNKFLTAASANDEFYIKTWGSLSLGDKIKCTEKYGGYYNDEFDSWMRRNSQAISEIKNFDTDKLKDFTGMNPYYLDVFLKYGTTDFDDWIQEMKEGFISETMEKEIVYYVSDHKGNPDFRKLAVACALKTLTEIGCSNIGINHQFFYFDDSNENCSCGFARRILANILCENLDCFKVTVDNIICIISYEENHSTLGLYVEMAYKVMAFNNDIPEFSIEVVDEAFNIHKYDNMVLYPLDKCILFHLVIYNAKAVDFVIAYRNNLYRFQVAIRDKHDDDILLFRSNLQESCESLEYIEFFFYWFIISWFEKKKTIKSGRKIFKDKTIMVIYKQTEKKLQESVIEAEKEQSENETEDEERAIAEITSQTCYIPQTSQNDVLSPEANKKKRKGPGGTRNNQKKAKTVPGSKKASEGKNQASTDVVDKSITGEPVRTTRSVMCKAEETLKLVAPESKKANKKWSETSMHTADVNVEGESSRMTRKTKHKADKIMETVAQGAKKKK